MKYTVLIDDQFTAEARRLLEVGRRYPRGAARENPVTGMHFAHGLDPIVRQVRDAKALRARDRFARLNPNLPPLPLSYREWGRLKGAFDLNHALAHYARSLDSWNYDIDDHPPFDAYVRGLLCSPRMRELFAAIADRFPPEPLKGLRPGDSYVIGDRHRRWLSMKEVNELDAWNASCAQCFINSTGRA